MKKFYTLFASLIIMGSLMAQAPQSFKYQAIARDASGQEITDQEVSMQISILQGSAAGTAVYVETFTPTTNGFGLINLTIGEGTVVSGDFSAIAWSSNTYFLKVEMDDTGGTAYEEFGTSQLLSVPYALHAKTAESTTQLETRLDSLISALSPPVAAFTADETIITVDGTVQFTDESSNTPTSWSWDFGDGSGESTDQNPSHVYSTDGTYTVTLTATNDNGSDDEIKTDYITVNPPPPVAAFSADETVITVDGTVQFTDESTNTPTSWLWNFGDGTGESTEQSPSHVYNTDGTYTVTLTATNAYGSDDEVKTDYITVLPVGTVYNATTGDIWMDRNLGASQVATSKTDAAAYGDLYQWGRLTDGHEKRGSGTTSTLSSTDDPGHSNFIIINTSPYDWRSPQNDYLWQGVSGINNPCPTGFRIPTATELDNERQTWSSNNSAGAFASPLKFTIAGYRYYYNGSLNGVGSDGTYWSSSISGTDANYITIGSSDSYVTNLYRAFGLSVRCIKE
ncbi:MAG: PKD domain-containing protein [Bacteroidales bacterium]|nr:PKD domain-containing protein [Bacteroidales bacterium]